MATKLEMSPHFKPIMTTSLKSCRDVANKVAEENRTRKSLTILALVSFMIVIYFTYAGIKNRWEGLDN